MIREVIGRDIPEKYGQQDDVKGYRSLLGRHDKKFSKVARESGFQRHLRNKRVWLKPENLDGSLPTHFLLEHLGGTRSFLEEHRIDFPIQGPEELNTVLISFIELYKVMHSSTSVNRSVNPIGFERLLRGFRNPADPALDEFRGIWVIE